MIESLKYKSMVSWNLQKYDNEKNKSGVGFNLW